jgi:hypothetical protein
VKRDEGGEDEQQSLCNVGRFNLAAGEPRNDFGNAELRQPRLLVVGVVEGHETLVIRRQRAVKP